MKSSVLKTSFVLLILINSFIWANSFLVGSWNIRTTEMKKLHEGESWDNRGHHVAEILRVYDFDIVSLQEATFLQIDTILNALPEYSYIGKAARDGKKNGNFNPILFKTKKYVILESGTFWLSPTPDVPSMGWDTDSKRICTWAILRNLENNKKIGILNTHLDHKGKLARINGVIQILDFIKKLPDIPILLMGDFNSESNSEVYKTITESKILIDASLIASKKYVTGGTFNNFKANILPKKTIDFIFSNKKISVLHYSVLNMVYWENDSLRLYSDHNPIRLQIRLNDKAE